MGFKAFSSMNSVYNRASRYFLGVGKYVSNMAVQGDTGWTTAFISQWAAISQQLCKYSIMADNRINMNVLHVLVKKQKIIVEIFILYYEVLERDGQTGVDNKYRLWPG